MVQSSSETDNLVEPEVQYSAPTSQQIQLPTVAGVTVTVEQVSPQTNALQNDRITREKTNMCISWHSPARCIIFIFWYTETDAEGGRGTGKRKGLVL